jgi:hypothetical protein
MAASDQEQATPSLEPPGAPPANAKSDPRPPSGPSPAKARSSENDRDKERWSPERMLKDVLSGSKEAFSSLGAGMTSELKKPTTGAAIAGGLVVGSAIAVGAAETAVGALAAYVVYRTIKKPQ